MEALWTFIDDYRVINWRVRVVSEDGMPVKGATVIVGVIGPDGVVETDAWVSNADGIAANTFPVLRPGIYEVFMANILDPDRQYAPHLDRESSVTVEIPE
jgi:hypothetical protein